MAIHILNYADIDDCLPGPCLNNGTCEDGINSYRCHCSQGFTGPTCKLGKMNFRCLSSDLSMFEIIFNLANAPLVLYCKVLCTRYILIQNWGAERKNLISIIEFRDHLPAFVTVTEHPSYRCEWVFQWTMCVQ